MYGKYFVGNRKFAVMTLTGMEGRRERGGGERAAHPHPSVGVEGWAPLPSLPLPSFPELTVDNPMM